MPRSDVVIRWHVASPVGATCGPLPHVVGSDCHSGTFESRSDPVYDAAAAIAATSPEYEGAGGLLWCPYCGQGGDDGEEWGHADDCPWLTLARAFGTLPGAE